MKKSILILLFILTFNHINAQLGFGKIEDINRIKEVPLLVILQEKSEKTIKKITKSKKADINQYYSDIESFNTAIRDGFENSWVFSNKIKFITTKELETYNSKSNKRKYAYFQLLIDEGDDGFSLLESKGLITTYNYALYLTGQKKPVYSYMYSSNLPNSADFKFISQQIQNYLVGREKLKSGKKSRKEMVAEFNKNAHEIKNKTLLLNKEDLTENLIDEIKNIYKYDYKITTKDEIDKAILNNDESIAYLKVVPMGQATGSTGPIKVSKLLFLQYIMDAKNGQILTFIRPSSMGLGGTLGTALKDSKSKMKIKDLKKIIKAINPQISEL
ncbi:hypothetical protein [Ulvibacterium marinum]|uniref:hypothetical protein n=1 Tax=Ulvibacterium marinum TaxID=2419782 RepID=UPI002495915E|nr:hypothetical protein [Ulvibacterium marinum]